MYSQDGEDLFIESHMTSTTPGNFFDIGANDGITYSNSRLFIEKYGFNAVLVEPTSKCIAKLAELYSNNPNIEIYPYAIDTTESDSIIYIGDLEPNTINQVATMSDVERNYWETNRSVVYTEEHIKTKTVSNMLSEIKLDTFDIISIDTEGIDNIILDELIKLGHRPEFIIFEHNSNPVTIENMKHSVSGLYQVVWENSINFILQKL